MRHALPGKALGFTMLEALIAVLILAVGVLSVANLLIKSYRFTQQGAYDTLAQQLAANVADRIRTNSGAMSSYVFDTSTAGNITSSTNFYQSGGSTGCTGSDATCSAATVNFDLSEWMNAVKASLPGGRGVICYDNPTYNLTGGFSWACTGKTTDPLVVKIGWVSRFSSTDQGTGVAASSVLADTSIPTGSSVQALPQAMIVVDTGGN